jgi:hypothetical protein
MSFSLLERLLSRTKPGNRGLILPLGEQIEAWRRANREMNWGIKEEELRRIQLPPAVDEDDRHEGFIGAVLFYGFGHNGSRSADALLSGKKAWE